MGAKSSLKLPHSQLAGCIVLSTGCPVLCQDADAFPFRQALHGVAPTALSLPKQHPVPRDFRLTLQTIIYVVFRVALHVQPQVAMAALIPLGNKADTSDMAVLICECEKVRS